MNIIIKLATLLFGFVAAFFFGVKTQKTKNTAAMDAIDKKTAETLKNMNDAAKNISNDKQSLIDSLNRDEF